MKKRAKTKPYVGLRKSGERDVFGSDKIPTEESHGEAYYAVIGPFRTVKAAHLMAKYGANNPHLSSVADAERMSKKFRMD